MNCFIISGVNKANTSAHFQSLNMIIGMFQIPEDAAECNIWCNVGSGQVNRLVFCTLLH